MAKAKKERTPAQIAATERMVAARKEKLAAKETEKNTPVVPEPESTAETPLTLHDDGAPQPRPPMDPSPFAQASEADKDKIIIALQQELLEAYRANANNNISKEQVLTELGSMQQPPRQDFNNGVTVSAQGGIQGRITKYPLTKEHYPDPRDRLYDDPRLRRHNLRDNYILTWEVQGEQYVKDGITYAEPRFIVQLFRRLFDDMDEPTGQAALISRMMLHEDEFVAQIIADKMGMLQNFNSVGEMLDEIRYHRIRDWLLPIFIPVKAEEHRNKKTEMVIDGKAVEVWDTEKVLGESAADDKASTIRQQVAL